MNAREKLLAVTVIIFFVCVVVWVVRTTPTEPPRIEKVDPPTTVEYEGNTIVEEKDGKILWELTCSKMVIDSVTQNAELSDVIWKFYQHEQDKVWELKSDTGIYYQAEKFIHVEGNVNVTNSDGAQVLSDKMDWYFEKQILTATGNISVDNNDGAKLWSDKLDYFVAEDKIIATGNVKISKDDMRAFGDTAYADNDFKHFGLMGNAKILKGVKDN